MFHLSANSEQDGSMSFPIESLPPRVRIYDTTLRDGNQGVGINFSLNDKLKISRELDSVGVDYIEGGWPNPTNLSEGRYFDLVKRDSLRAKVSAFGMTRRVGVSAAKDENLRALMQANTEYVTLFGKSWTFQVDRVLEVSREENLRMIRESVQLLKRKGRHVIYDAEHFFDGFKADREYSMSTISMAQQAGAEELVLCDTRGGSLPNEVYRITSEVSSQTPLPLGIHAHNDRGLAVANSLFAVAAGATHVQGTVNGIGERCGNADLIQVASNLELMGVNTGIDMSKLTRLARFVAEVANMRQDEHDPFVGSSAFAHKGGIHGHAVGKTPEAYEFASPTIFGNTRRVPVSSQAGRASVHTLGSELGFKLSRSDPAVSKILKSVKELEAEGYHLENANGSLTLIYARALQKKTSFFRIVDWSVFVSESSGRTLTQSVVKLHVGGDDIFAAAEGNGPVNALDKALRDALRSGYPEISEIKLTGYRVKEIDTESGTAAKVGVYADFSHRNENWTTVGVSMNILSASKLALVDGYQYFMFKLVSRRRVSNA